MMRMFRPTIERRFWHKMGINPYPRMRRPAGVPTLHIRLFCALMAHFMNTSLASLETFKQDPSFRDAREILAAHIRSIPNGNVNFGDSLEMELVTSAQPGFVYPVLPNSMGAEREGLLEIRLRAHVDFKRGALQTLLNGESVDAEYIFDVDQSVTLMETLDAPQLASVVRYAYSKRMEELEKKIGKMPAGVLKLLKRLEDLELHFHTILEMILGETDEEEQG